LPFGVKLFSFISSVSASDPDSFSISAIGIESVYFKKEFPIAAVISAFVTGGL
jgi:hypothetical protein